MPKKLRIGQIGPINVPIPPKKYGGTEKIIFWLCEKMKKKGHEVFLFAAGDSKTSAKLIPILKKSLWTFKHRESSPYYAYEMAVVARKAKELKLDVLHDHLGPWSLALYGQTDIPIIHTLHVPIDGKDRIWAYDKLKAKLVSISNEQRKPAKHLNYLGTVYNGIDLSHFKFNPKPKDYYVWVGELSPRKGIMEVIRIAKRTKINLVIAGRIPPKRQGSDFRFFNEHVKKELNKGKIKFVGEVTKKQLVSIYGNAKCFLYPLQWEEPFGLTMAESMACGTPVIAFKRGSVAEVVKHGKTGFVVPAFKNKRKNYNGFIRAMKNIDTIKREDCRKWAMDNFSIQAMIDNYEKLYYKVIR